MNNIEFDFETEIPKEVEKVLNNTNSNNTNSIDVNKDNLLQILESVLINPLDDLPPPPTCLSIEFNNEKSTISTLGNFSLIIGKAKSKKTFLITIALAAATKNDIVLNRFKGHLPHNQNKVLYFDTEQGKYHVLRSVKRVCEICDIRGPGNLVCYGLRKFTPLERLELIEAAIYNTDNLGFVVIDGIRDLVTSINDEEQATTLTSKLLKWTEERNIHIMCVLHQNKGDNNARGHLGSEVTNKAETVLTVTKSEENKNISIVNAEFCRDKEPEPFAFEIDEFGMPFMVEDWEMRQDLSHKKPKILPNTFTDAKHYSILKSIFIKEPELSYANLCIKIKVAFAENNISLGNDKAKIFVSYYTTNEFIKKLSNQKMNKTIYSLSSSDS
ncbi:MAG: AAA family ATPase [Bacteroidales bacterium]